MDLALGHAEDTEADDPLMQKNRGKKRCSTVKIFLCD